MARSREPSGVDSGAAMSLPTSAVARKCGRCFSCRGPRSPSASGSGMVSNHAHPPWRMSLRCGARLGLLPGLPRQYGGVEPGQAEPWVGRVVADRVDELLPAVVVEDVHVAVPALDQCQDV